MPLSAVIHRRPLAAVILAGGESSRMGAPKALLPYRGRTFVEYLLKMTQHPRVSLTRIVVGAHSGEIRQKLGSFAALAVENPDWQKGQLSSIQAAIRSLPAGGTEGMILCPVDHPIISTALVAQLIDAFDSSSKPAVADQVPWAVSPLPLPPPDVSTPPPGAAGWHPAINTAKKKPVAHHAHDRLEKDCIGSCPVLEQDCYAPTVSNRQGMVILRIRRLPTTEPRFPAFIRRCWSPSRLRMVLAASPRRWALLAGRPLGLWAKREKAWCTSLVAARDVAFSQRGRREAARTSRSE